MKRIILGLFATAVLLACSDEQNEDYSAEVFDTAKVAALSTATPDASLDGTAFGLYRGVFVSADTQFHGEIVVSVDEVEQPIALVMLDNGKELYFKGQSLGENQFRFKTQNAFFVLDTTDPSDVVVTSSDLEGRPIHIRVLKDDASRGVGVDLGTFVDNLDPGFAGTWDLISTSTSTINVPIPVPPFVFPVTVDNIDEVVICYDNGTPGGRMFNDTTQENFTTTGCGFAPAGTYAPFSLGPGTITLPIVGETPVEEYAAFGQTTDILGNTLSWDLGSTINGPVPGVRTYVDLTCNTTTSGFWSWNGRNGIILLN